MKRIQEINKVTANIKIGKSSGEPQNLSPLTFCYIYMVRNYFEKRSGILVVAFSIGPKPYLNCWSLKDQFYGSRTSKITCGRLYIVVGPIWYTEPTFNDIW